MTNNSGRKVSLDTLIEDITVDAFNDDEKLWAFRQVIEDEVDLPADGFVIGEPVEILEIDYDGNERCGLTATCLRKDGSKHVVAAVDVQFAAGSTGERYLAAYCKWLGVQPRRRPTATRLKRTPRADAVNLAANVRLDFVVLAVKQRAVRCRRVGKNDIVTLRAGRLREAVPGEILTVKPHKQWVYGGNPYVSGDIIASRLEVDALNLKPLRLESAGDWNPAQHYWGEEDEPLEEWALPIAARGPRAAFIMEQVLPGWDMDELFSDPISKSNDLRDAGNTDGAIKILMDLCQSDLRCLDAHSHLGNIEFEGSAKDALRHYAVGVRIGELSLGNAFDRVLEWGHIDNRPFLRCLQGYGLCLWRLGRFDEALQVFNRMLWLNPSDNQGVRGLLDDVRAERTWESSKERG